MRTDAIILAGRGWSIEDYIWPDDVPIMAVSSGIFVCALPRTPEHFCTLDGPMHFDHPHAWQDGAGCLWWDFLRNPEIVKHVPNDGIQDGKTLALPEDTPPEVFKLIMQQAPRLMDPRAGWGQYPNVVGWPFSFHAEPNLSPPTRTLGIAGALPNSVLFAVQVAKQLGFGEIRYAGVDFQTPNGAYFKRILAGYGHPVEEVACA